jgi:uncharacterized protein YndB with AHSA1/START domain
MQQLLEAMSELAPELTHDERSIVATRLFRAPRKMVYEAFADPKQVVLWWGPEGFTTIILEMDLRPGGEWRLVMHGPDGTNYPNDMIFTEVVPMERIVLDLIGGKQGAEPVRLQKTITFADEDGGTRLTFNIRFASREARDVNVRTYKSVEGSRQMFNRLTTFLTNKELSA